MFFDSKGQSGAVFKLLIGAVIGLAIIGIIYSIISIMNNQKTYLNEAVFSNNIKMAMKNPTGKDYWINNFTFRKDRVLSKKSLSEQTSLATGCITLEKDNSAPSSVISTDNLFSFTKEVIVDISVKCTAGDAEGCPINCTLTVYNRAKTH